MLAKRSAELSERREVAIFDVFNILRKARIDIEKIKEFMSADTSEINYIELPKGKEIRKHYD